MYIPNQQKVDKRHTPVTRHRQQIGEFNAKTQEKHERKEPTKMSDKELNEGTKVIWILGAIITICLLLLGISLLT